MTAEEAWKELTEKFGRLEVDGESLLYFWEPGPDVPMDARLIPDDEMSLEEARSLEGIPLAYAVTTMANSTGQTIVYAKWPRQGWSANPWNKRHLIRHLIDELREETHGR